MANLMSKVKESLKSGELSLINRRALNYLKCPENMSIDVVITTEFEEPCLAFSNLSLRELPKALSILKPEVLESCLIYMNVPSVITVEDSSETHYELIGSFQDDDKLKLEPISFTPDESFEFSENSYVFITGREERQIIQSLYDYIRSLKGMSNFMY